MTMHGALHPIEDVHRLYMSRKEGGRGLASYQDSVEALIQRLEDFIENCGGRLITATRNNTHDMRNSRPEKKTWEEK